MNIRRQLLVIMGLILSLNSGSLSLAQESEKAQKKAPPVYDTEADAAADIAAAVERAKKEHKRVLVVYGGNWCGWCVKLDEFFKKDRNLAAVRRRPRVEINHWSAFSILLLTSCLYWRHRSATVKVGLFGSQNAGNGRTQYPHRRWYVL